MTPRRLVNAANALTLSRFVTAPVILWLLHRLHGPAVAGFSPWVAPAALALLIVTLLTDLFDGMTARRLGIVTNFGKIMDPVADSTFFMTLLFGLSACPRFAIPIWMPILVLYREVAMHVLRRYAALEGVVLAAKVSGKAKMAVQSVTVSLWLALVSVVDLGWVDLSEPLLGNLLYGAVLLIVVVNWLSMIEYSRDVPDLIREYHDTAQTR